MANNDSRLYERFVVAAFGETSEADYYRFAINPSTRLAIMKGLREVYRLGRLVRGVPNITFQKAWEEYKKKGYQYGDDALEQVRLGWDIAHGKKQ